MNSIILKINGTTRTTGKRSKANFNVYVKNIKQIRNLRTYTSMNVCVYVYVRTNMCIVTTFDAALARHAVIISVRQCFSQSVEN